MHNVAKEDLDLLVLLRPHPKFLIAVIIGCATGPGLQQPICKQEQIQEKNLWFNVENSGNICNHHKWLLWETRGEEMMASAFPDISTTME